MDSFGPIDTAILRLFGSFAGHSDAFDYVVLRLTDIDLIKGGVIIALVWWIWFDRYPDAWAARATVVQTIIAGLLAAAISRGMQNFLLARPRPMNGAAAFVAPSSVTPDVVEWAQTWSSFPSDHAALFFALATGLCLVNRRVGAIAMLWSIVVVSLPRIYVGLHYPTDIIAGALLGIAIMCLVRAVPIAALEPLRRWEKMHAALFYGAAFILTYELADLFEDVRTIGIDVLHTAHLVMG